MQTSFKVLFDNGNWPEDSAAKPQKGKGSIILSPYSKWKQAVICDRTAMNVVSFIYASVKTNAFFRLTLPSLGGKIYIL